MFKNRLAVNFIFLVNGFIYANWVSRLPEFQVIYQMDNAATGLVLLVLAIGAVIAMPVTGWLIVKNGSERVTQCGVLTFCILTPFAAVMPNYWTLGIVFFGMGISSGILDVAMNAQAVLIEEKYQKPIMASFHAVFSGGMMLGAGTGALFTKWELPLFVHLLIISLLGMALVLWSIFQLVEDRPQPTLDQGESLFRLPTKELLGIGLISFCCMLGEGAMADWSTNYMRNIAFSSAFLAPLGLGAFSVAMMLGRILGDRARSVFGDYKLLVFNSLISIFGVFLFILFPSPVIVIIGLFLVGLGLSVIVPIAYSQAGNTKELAPGVGISMVTTIGYTGFLFGPPIIGFLADWQTLRFAMVFVGILFVLMLSLSLFSAKAAPIGQGE